jgi:hypothetical protein
MKSVDKKAFLNERLNLGIFPSTKPPFLRGKKGRNTLDSSVRILAGKYAILCAQQTTHDKTLQ